MLKVEAIIEEVVNGEVTQLRIGDDVYAIRFVGYYKDVEEAVEKEEENLDKGEILYYLHKTPIYEKILEDITNNVGKEYDKESYTNIIKKYYPDSPQSTIRKNIYVYKTAVEKQFEQTKETLYYDKVYRRWVSEDDYNKVKEVLKTNGIPNTTESIINTTNLTPNAVRSTLRYMKNRGEIKNIIDNNGKWYYSITE